MDTEQAQIKQKFRGKLYALSEDQAWEDTGTGFASIIGVGENRRLVFRSEESSEVLHDRPIFPADSYQLQGEGEGQTIIVWEDAEMSKDWALSFQDPDGTNEIWESICGESVVSDEKRFLPLPKLGNLSDLCRMLTCVPPSQREVLAAECMTPKFISGLQEAFHTAEDLNNDEALSSLWHMAKGIFLLSNPKLTERYLKNDVYEDILGMLEYDTGLSVDRRIAHRQVLKLKVKYNDVLVFDDQDTLDRIHLNYRLGYLKDIVLPRLLDDAALMTLQQMIHQHLQIILEHLQKNDKLLDALFQQLQQKNLHCLLLLQDICRQAKFIQPADRAALYEKMVERQLFEFLVPFFEESEPEKQARFASTGGFEYTGPPVATEILLLSVNTNDPSHLRRFLTAENSTEGRTLLSHIIRIMLTEQDLGVQVQISDMLKIVMDPTALENRERDRCLDVFYERGAFDEIMAPLRADAKTPVGPSALFGLQIICELLSFAVQQHGLRAKIYVMRHSLAQNAVKLMAMPQRFLQLAPVRLLRAIVGTKDDAYHRYLMKNGLFTPMMRNFAQSLQPPALGGNLLVSVTLEVLEFIRVENIKILVDHICSKHSEVLRANAPKFKTLEGLLLKHQQNLEYEAFPPEHFNAGGPMAAGGGAARGRQRSPGREDSDDDEAYFESLDDDDDTQTSAGKTVTTTPGANETANTDTPDASPEVPTAGLKGLLGGYEDEDDESEKMVDVASGRGAKSDVEVKADASVAGAGAVDEVDKNAIDQDVAAADATPLEPSQVENAPETVNTNGSPNDVAAAEKIDPDGQQPKEEVQPISTENAEATEDTGGAAKEGGEKSLNHVSKRLKTSASPQR